MFFGTPHEGGNQDSTKVKLGLKAAKITSYLGFSPNESIVEILTSGSLFGDFIRESFRHQLEQYHIVSFWEKNSTVSNESYPSFLGFLLFL
jgi:hypothetical protein